MTRKQTKATEFADDWLKHARSKPGSKEWEETSWVIGASVEWSRQRTDVLCNAIAKIAEQKLSNHEIEMLGCGPLETLLSWDYDTSSASFWKIAKVSPHLMSALSFVIPPSEKEDDFLLNMGRLRH